jgi:hypothetical protein
MSQNVISAVFDSRQEAQRAVETGERALHIS